MLVILLKQRAMQSRIMEDPERAVVAATAVCTSDDVLMPLGSTYPPVAWLTRRQL